MTTSVLRVAVIGRAGQLARELIRTLEAAGREVVVIGRPAFDLRQPAAVRQEIIRSRPDVVINAAAYTAVDRAEDEPLVAEAVNATGAGAVAAAAAELGIPVIHVSTDYVFDGRKSQPYVETDPTGPLGVYGRTKLEGERLVAAANSRHVILRTAWVASPFGQNFVKTMLRLAAERPELRVVDDQRGSPTFAADLAAAISLLAPRLVGTEVPASHFGIFHAANTGETSWCGFARAIMAGARARGGAAVPVLPIATADYPTKARRPAYSLLATGKLATVHGISLPAWQTSLDTCLDELVGPVRDPAAA